MAHFHSVIKVLAIYERADESTRETISCAIRIDNVLRIELLYRVNPHGRPRCGRCYNCGFST